VRRLAANHAPEADDRVEAAGPRRVLRGDRDLEGAGDAHDADVVVFRAVAAQAIERAGLPQALASRLYRGE
jgi:hypothetical protein